VTSLQNAVYPLQRIFLQREALASLHEVNRGRRRQGQLNAVFLGHLPVIFGQVEEHAGGLCTERNVVR
jgi:hypothetical protein